VLPTGQGPYFGQATWFARFHPEKVQSVIDRYVSEILRVLGVLDEGLSRNGTGWLVGDKFTYADLSFVTWAVVGEGMLKELDKAKELEMFPFYTSWLSALKRREKVSRSLQAIAEKRATHGLK